MRVIRRILRGTCFHSTKVEVVQDTHPISKCLAPPQPSSKAGFCNQRPMDGSKTVETKQMWLLVDDIYRNNIPDVCWNSWSIGGHPYGAAFPNFFGQHSWASIS
ncbi:hypothetical protein TNCV_2874551 [Trichonephila clavipes]|nr:hypothetical protein TNCV_2874551 [Trichonephila clavipes]